MTQGDQKRQFIFDKYSANLHFLNDTGLIPHINLDFENTFICPGCMRQFSPDDLKTSKANHLTLEDVPPKSLGGKANILTCFECNNSAGTKIDVHLYSRMFEMDKRMFVKGTSFHAKFSQGNEIVQGEINVGEDGTITVKHQYKQNKKDRLEKFVKDVSPTTGNPLMNIEFYPTRIDFKRLQVALLKTAYLQCFEKYGYLIIADPIFDKVRDQIKNPDGDIYPSQFWFVGPFKEANQGVHFVTNDGLECIMSIFSLKSHSTRVFGAILPIKPQPIIEIIAGFHASIALDVEYSAVFERFDHPSGYLKDLQAIELIKKLIEKLKSR
jgi:hypothetical protein